MKALVGYSPQEALGKDGASLLLSPDAVARGERLVEGPEETPGHRHVTVRTQAGQDQLLRVEVGMAMCGAADDPESTFCTWAAWSSDLLVAHQQPMHLITFSL
jgi:hypothetical protein